MTSQAIICSFTLQGLVLEWIGTYLLLKCHIQIVSVAGIDWYSTSCLILSVLLSSYLVATVSSEYIFLHNTYYIAPGSGNMFKLSHLCIIYLYTRLAWWCQSTWPSPSPWRGTCQWSTRCTPSDTGHHCPSGHWRHPASSSHWFSHAPTTFS